MNIPSWRNTFNTDHKTWWLISKALDAASHAGYPYLEWNGRVYDVLAHVQKGQLVQVCLTSDLKG